MRKITHIASSCLLIIAISLAACSQTDPPNEPVEMAEVATETPAPTPTSLPPTVTPTPALPAVTPTHTPIPPTPTPTPQIYVVQQYDTLLGIALEFGLTTEALAVANGIEDEDFLQLGQEIIIPVAGETSEALTEQAVETSPTVAPTEQTTETSPAEALAETADTAGSPKNVSTETDVVAAAPASPPLPTLAYDGPPLPDISHPTNINPLTGLAIDDPAKLQRRPLMVRIGNDVGARQSQVGLNQADVVYEEITEWWVTRFSAIFLAEMLNTVGPVRSARLINVQLAPQYQAALAHSGGSDPVRWEISQAPIANLDEYYNPSPYFYRPNQGWQTRLAIDAEAARNYMISKGLDAAINLQGFIFSDAPEGNEPGPNIYIPYPQATSFTEWHYDEANGKYLRWIDGAPLVDAGDGQQISAANVIIYFAEHQATDIVEDSNGMTAIRMIVNGVGPAWFFRDGQLTKGFWQTDGTRPPYFTKEDGTAYALKPGNTWVEVVPTYFTIGLNSADEAGSR